jgi:hypothetical protein
MKDIDINELVDVDVNELVDEDQAPQLTAKDLVEDPDMNSKIAARRGFEEGVTFSHSAELRAIPDTAEEVMNALGEAYAKDGIMGTVNVLPTITETHRKHTRLQQDVHDQLLEKYPGSYMTAEAVGGLASEAGVLALQSAIAGPVGLSGVLSAHFLANFAHGVGKADTTSLAETINEGIEAGGIGAGVPVYAQKGVQATARSGVKLLDKFGRIDKAVKQGVLKFFGMGPEATKMAAKKYNKNVDSMLLRVANYTDAEGKPLIDTSLDRLDMLDKLEREAKRYGNQMGRNLDKVDSIPMSRDPANLFDDIDFDIFQGKNGMLNAGDLDKKYVGVQLRKNLRGLFFEPKQYDKAGNLINDRQIRKGFNASMVHDYMESAYKGSQKLNRHSSLKPTEEAYAAGKERIAKRLHGFLDDIIEDASDTLPDVHASYVSSRLKFGDVRVMEKQLAKTLRPDQKGAGLIGSIINERLVNGGTALSLLTTGSAAYGAATNNKPLMYASMLGMAMKGVYNHPKVNGFVATSARNFADAIQKNPDKYNKIAGTMLSAAAHGHHDLLMDTFALGTATVELNNRPLARTTQDLFTKQDAVLTIVNQFDPEVAKNLSEAINNGDTTTIAGIMSSILPKAPQGTVQEGIGWDGRAILPEEKEAVLGKLRTLSPRQRQTLIPKFEQDGIIPEEYYMENNPKAVNVFQHIKKQRGKIKKADY